MDKNKEIEKLEKEIEILNRLEKCKQGSLVVHRFYENPKYDPNLYYLERNTKGLTQEEFDEMKQYYAGVIILNETLVTPESVHKFRT